MPLWGKNDQANNDPKFSSALVHQGSGTAGEITVNQNLYHNNTPSAFTNNQTVSMLLITAADIKNHVYPAVHQPGWYLVRQGTGGRAGRVWYEAVVAVKSAYRAPPTSSANLVTQSYTLPLIWSHYY